MRIAHIANMYGPKSGGLRTTVDALASKYESLGHQVLTIVPGKQYVAVRVGSWTQVTVPGVVVPFSGGYRIILRRSLVRNELARFNPAVLEISDRTTLLKIARWARERGIKTSFFAHERLDGVIDAFAPRLPWKRNLIKYWNTKTLNSVDCIVATTDIAAHEFRELLANDPSAERRLVKVPLGVDLVRFQTISAEVGNRDTGVASDYILACTRFSKEKDPEFLLDIARELKAADTKCRMVLVGDGPLRSGLEQQSLTEQLPIEFLGFVTDKAKLASLMAGARCFLAVGPIETFGLAALESLACGTYVLCRDSSAISEVISPECGSALPRNAKLWGQEIESVLVMDLAKVSNQARSRAEEFSWDECASNMLKIHMRAA
jgi:alpha-1,6-mannosyltransferase